MGMAQDGTAKGGQVMLENNGGADRREGGFLQPHPTPPGPIPRNAEHASSDDSPPTDDELRQATKRNRNVKPGRTSSMRAKDLKE